MSIDFPLQLLAWVSPAFPIGSFSYSHGLEWRIDSRELRTAEALEAWLRDILELGSGWNDAVIFVEAHRAAAGRDKARLLAVAELAEAQAPSRERHLETLGQGKAFLDAIDAAWPCASVNWLREAGGAAYPVALAGAAAGHGIGLDAALTAYLHAFVANLVSVGVRLVPIGQTAGLRVLAGLHPNIVATAERAMRSSLDDLGSATILSDILRCATRPNIRGCSAHDAAQWPAPRWHRRARRLRQDHLDRDALQGDARPLFDRRHHQRHLHQGGCADPQPAPGAAGGPHHGRGNRRLPAYRDPRGCLHQPPGDRRDAQARIPDLDMSSSSRAATIWPRPSRPSSPT